jgi:hypothetical protein
VLLKNDCSKRTTFGLSLNQNLSDDVTAWGIVDHERKLRQMSGVAMIAVARRISARGPRSTWCALFRANSLGLRHISRHQAGWNHLIAADLMIFTNCTRERKDLSAWPGAGISHSASLASASRPTIAQDLQVFSFLHLSRSCRLAFLRAIAA